MGEGWITQSSGLQVAAAAPAQGPLCLPAAPQTPGCPLLLPSWQPVLLCPFTTRASTGTCISTQHKGFCLLLPSSLSAFCGLPPSRTLLQGDLGHLYRREQRKDSGRTCAVSAKRGSTVSSGRSRSHSALQISTVPLSYTPAKYAESSVCLCVAGDRAEGLACARHTP